MQKWQRMSLLGLVTASFMGLGGGAGTAQAAQHTVATFPKSLRGTWYTYDSHQYYRTRITAKTITVNGTTGHLHPVKAAGTNVQSDWVQATPVTYRGEHWINVRGWFQAAGSGDDYRKVTHTLKGKRHAALQYASGSVFKTSTYGYRSKALAKTYAHHYYAGDRH